MAVLEPAVGDMFDDIEKDANSDMEDVVITNTNGEDDVGTDDVDLGGKLMDEESLGGEIEMAQNGGDNFGTELLDGEEGFGRELMDGHGEDGLDDNMGENEDEIHHGDEEMNDSGREGYYVDEHEYELEMKEIEIGEYQLENEMLLNSWQTKMKHYKCHYLPLLPIHL
jgi:PHD/YefM family antitoxin component YafN of YafNO toxin-antitoxin module